MSRSADSAGLLVFRRRGPDPELLLVHPGGPFWRGKDEHAWSFPKGKIEAGEAPLAAAKREFQEETGLMAEGDLIELTPLKRRAGGQVYCWLVEADLDLRSARSNTFELKSSRTKATFFPELDAYAYCAPALALRRVHLGLRPIVEEALHRLGSAESASGVQSPPV